MIHLSGGRVLGSNGFLPANVLIEGNTIVGVGAVTPANGALSIDATGLAIGPGLVDMHAHFRDPGEEWKEDLRSGSTAAAAGGFTAVVTMPNTIPPIDKPSRATDVVSRAAGIGAVEIAVAGAITEGRAGTALADIEGMYAVGVRMFSDDGDSVADGELLRRAMTMVADLPGAFIAQHAEDRSIAAGGQMHEGAVSVELDLQGLPARAEIEVIARDIELCRDTGAHLHVQHLSTHEGLDLVRAARREGCNVTAEVTPHHLTLTDAALRSRDTNLKMYPPLRGETDRLALIGGLRSGEIDVVATDHAPHSPADKDVTFEKAARGIIGLETAMPLVLEVLDGDLILLFERMSVCPAALMGLDRHGQLVEVGRPANLVLIDPNAHHSVEASRSRSVNSPFFGRPLVGRVKATIYEGHVVYRKDDNARE